MIQRFAPELGRFDENDQVLDQLGLPRKIIDLPRPDAVLKLFIGRG